MSCLLQHPSIPLHYSQSSQLGNTKNNKPEIMQPPHCYPLPHDSRDFSHPLFIAEGHDGFARSGRCMSDTPLHSSKTPIYQHPEVYLSRDHYESDGIDIVVKNEPFYPQHNSPVEFFKVEPPYYQNGFQRSPSPSHQFMDEYTTRMQPGSPFAAHQSTPASATEIFSLNLKLELENYLHTHQGDQFRNFRGQVSPSSSLSCSSSSLLSIATAGGGAASPTRRHSFSSTVVTNAQSLSNLHNQLTVGTSGGGGVLQGGTTTTTTSPAYYRQRSHTYSNSSSKSHPYPITRRLNGWNSSTIAAQNDLRDHVEGLRIRSISNMCDDQKEQSDLSMGDEDGRSGSSDVSQNTSRKGSMDDNKFDSQNFLFLGPFGKKRKMVRERQQSNESIEMPVHPLGNDEILLDYAASPTGSDIGVMKEKVEDIVEEDESEEIIDVCDDQSNQPLNLCLGDESETMERVRRLDINCPSGSAPSFPSYTSQMNMGSRAIPISGNHLISPPVNSVLRSQLLGLTQSLAPTPPQYQNQARDRSASMSAINPRNRITVIQDARVSLNTEQTQSSPSENPRGALGQLPATNGLSTLKANSSGTMEGATKRILECLDCGKVFSQLRNYRYHRSRHEGTSQFACTCPICFKQFNDKGYLSSHLKIHKNEKEYECEYCKKRFNQRVAYNMHVRIHTGVKPHECHLCEKAFSRKMLLRQHLRTHTGERPYRCDQCGKAFADRSNMLLHQRLHSGLRPFQCNECGKSFSKNHHLKTHLNHHAGIKPYQCSKCKASFSQSSNMKTHFRKCTVIPSEEVPPKMGEGVEAPGTLENSPGCKIESHSQLPHLSTFEQPIAEGGASYRQPNSYAFSFDEGTQPVSSSYPFLGGNEVSRNPFLQRTSPSHQPMTDCGIQEQGQAGAYHLGLPQLRVRSSSPLATSSYRQESPTSASAPSTYYFHQSQPDLMAVTTTASRMCGTAPTQGSHNGLAKVMLVSSPPTASTALNFELHSLRNRNLPFPNAPSSPCGELTSPHLSHRLSPQHLHSPQQEEYRRRSNTWSSTHQKLAGKKRPL